METASFFVLSENLFLTTKLLRQKRYSGQRDQLLKIYRNKTKTKAMIAGKA